ncbi:MAG: hypothetical protein H2205_07725 [Citrobacter pasteurii]|uniref:hypothetical protein n=1 Tax=Citrobacter pasteurii TaxID=1563222 RepID=UPI001838F039|nr:hypothetical protein [Citrobacter pasteurii]MBA4712363.1 hypothetical protein [Citrobacter pasteurii]
MNSETINSLLFIKDRAESISYQDPYQVWLFSTSVLADIDEAVEELKAIEALALEVDIQGSKMELSLQLTNEIGWFSSVEEYFKNLRIKVRNKAEPFGSFYIEELDSVQIEKICQSTKIYLQWCDLLSRISDHTDYDNTTFWPTYVFVMEGGKGKKITSHRLSLKSLDNTFLQDIQSSPCDLTTLTSGDLHSYERRLVMRSSLVETYTESENQNDFLSSLLKDPCLFWETFSVNYEVYINKYSINKIIYEVESQKLDFLSKLNNLIQENQTKSLTIPAVLVSTAIIKGWSLSALLLIFVAMLLTSAVVFIGIHNSRKSLNDIMESANRTLTLLLKENTDPQNIVVNNKITEVIGAANDKIKKKKENADSTLFYIELLIFIGLVVWAAFVAYQFRDYLLQLL